MVVELGSKSLLDYCIEFGIDEIVVAADERRDGMPIDALLKCKLLPIRLKHAIRLSLFRMTQMCLTKK